MWRAPTHALAVTPPRALTGLPPGPLPAAWAAARCRQVKSHAAEAALPEFDFERKVGRKIQLQKFRRQVRRGAVSVDARRWKDMHLWHLVRCWCMPLLIESLWLSPRSLLLLV